MEPKNMFSGEDFSALQRRDIQPYAQLDAALHPQLPDGLRFVALRQGERLSVLDGTQISVLSGKVRLSSSGRTLLEESTRHLPYRVPQRGDILQALENAVLALADRDFLDLITAWHALVRHAHEAGDATAERLQQINRVAPFRRLPLEFIVSAMRRMQLRHVQAGTEVLWQGSPAHTFFMLWSGTAEVWQQGFHESAPQLMAKLKAGDTFGEEALVAGNAAAFSVRMRSDGELLELPRAVFLELLARPRIEEISVAMAQERFGEGWIALDVRYAAEFDAGHLPHAQSLPLEQLRKRCGETLSRAQRYVTVCNSGKRSAVAALMLSELGYQVLNLKQGLHHANFSLVLSDAGTQDKAVA